MRVHRWLLGAVGFVGTAAVAVAALAPTTAGLAAAVALVAFAAGVAAGLFGRVRPAPVSLAVPTENLPPFDALSVARLDNAEMQAAVQKLEASRAEIRRQNRELKRLANLDPLTHCLNRRAFLNELQTLWGLFQIGDGTVAVVLADVDHFKAVNDTRGHAVGDEVLRAVARVLCDAARSSDLVCRYGGEEFCVALPGAMAAEAAAVAERVRQAVAAAPLAGVPVTVSLGVSAAELGAGTYQQLIDQADRALYAAKRTGRDRVVTFDPLASSPPAEKPAPAEEPPPIQWAAASALLAALAHRDPATAEHSLRVADLALMCADGWLPPAELRLLELAAMLHDVGKLGVPDAVLFKPEPLDADERRVLLAHQKVAAEIVAAAGASEPLADILRLRWVWHDGRYDGPAAPDPLAVVPLAARVLAVADAFDAMTSDRPHRKALSRPSACLELEAQAGTQFDPAVVDRFIDRLEQHRPEVSRPEFPVSLGSAVAVGTHLDALAAALAADDPDRLAVAAEGVRATAHGLGVGVLEVWAERLVKAVARADRGQATAIGRRLLDLCRATQHELLKRLRDDPLTAARSALAGGGGYDQTTDRLARPQPITELTWSVENGLRAVAAEE
jgi:diguanylate cyclase (GGDEF)-like protein/putative nucleotidyltransferase with HDIG domain